jgi:FAD/FMN-containing dehydrogenase/Fe-S oxidoreductase
MPSFVEELQEKVKGDLYFDPLTCQVYSVDASIFEVKPLAVVIPKTKEDLIQAVQIAYRHGIPVTARGAATGITGGCLGEGLIIDTSKYLNRVPHINIDQGYAICEPGVVQDELNQLLAPSGYRLGPDTSTGNRATLGGMLANNAAGARSLRYGKMVDHVLEIEMVLATGELIRFHSINEQEWKRKKEELSTEGTIYQTLWKIKQQEREEIERRFPPLPRRVSGYNLDELIKPEPFNVAKLIAGSEGTLGIMTEIKLQIVPQAKASALCLIYFDDLIVSMQAVPELLHFDPLSLEVIDDQIIELGRASPLMRDQLDWLKGHPKALLILELEGENLDDVKRRMEIVLTELQQKQMGYAQTGICNIVQMHQVWKLRQSGLGLLLSKRTYSRAIAFIEDVSVHPQHLADFMKQFCHYLSSKGKTAGIYGHAGSGCMHIRPYLNLQQSSEFALMRQIMLDVTDLLVNAQGTLSGEHGDGLIRSWLNPKLFGERLMRAFIELKLAFDPLNRMNPGKIVFPKDAFDFLRLSPTSQLKAPKTFLNFEREGGFELAVDLCNGNGLCRKKETVMCPSFQVTQEEFHSTRARAQALRAVVHGNLPLTDFTSHRMHDVMDLCISCKGCQTECPSQVDMAKLKAEFLYHYQNRHGTSLRSYLFAYIGLLNQWMSPFAFWVNTTNRSSLIKKGLDYLGITTKRPLPDLALQSFSKWFKQHPQIQKNKQVVLFNDTFTEFNHPAIGQAAVRVLQELGYEVILPSWHCCGRPLISKGFLKQAAKYADRVIHLLAPYASQHIPIIGLEPSCLLTIKDDYPDFYFSENEKLSVVVKACLTFDEFLANHVENNSLPLPFHTHSCTVKVHGHCHQKALVGMKPTLKVLKAIPGIQATEIQAGCCGMAGSFGYEKEHVDFSMQIGELRLFPAIREAPSKTLFVANGTSCRQQIADGTQRKAIHLAELIDFFMSSLSQQEFK